MKTILSIILLIAAGLLYFFFTADKLAALRARQIEVQRYETALQNAKKLDARIDSLLKAQNSVSEADREKMRIMLPDNVENVKLIIDFDNLLQSVVADRGTISQYKSAEGSIKKLAIESPKIVQSTGGQGSPSSESSKLGVATLSFSVSLTYGDFMEFLRRIEFSKRIMDIESIDFNAPNGNEVDPVYTINMVIKTYWLKYDASNNLDK